MSIFNKLFSKSTVKPTSCYPVTPPVPRTGYFEFDEGVLAESDDKFRKATFHLEPDNSGTIFFEFSFGKHPIGSFKTDPDSNRTFVYRVSDGETVGFVDNDDGYVYLSREGMHCAALKNGWYERYPDPIFTEIGRLLGDDRRGLFDEAGTHEIIGYYSGKRTAAGAAYISLIYECHASGHHQFYTYNK